MLLEQASWYQGYGQILNDCRGHNDTAGGSGNNNNNGKCLILCHPDVDAMAAARMLTYMLRADQVEYVLETCPTYDVLQRKVLPGSGNSVPYAAVVLINVGGTRNLSRLFGGHESDESSSSDPPPLLNLEQTTLYVMDGRLPVHLGNVYAGDHVVVFFDEIAYHNKNIDLPSDGDNLSGNDDDDDDEGSDSDSSDDDDDDILMDSDDASSEGEEEMDFGNDGVVGVARPNQARKDDQNEDDASSRRPEDDDDDMDYDGEDEGDGRRTPQKKVKRKARRTGEATVDTEALLDQASPSNDTAATETLDDDDLDDLDATQGTNNNTNNVNDTSVLQPLSPAERHRQRQDRLRVYYSDGSEYGLPAAMMVYTLARQMRFGTVADLLWLAMIGTTDAYLQSRLGQPDYAKLAGDLHKDCRQLFPPTDDVDRAAHAVLAEDMLVHRHNNNHNTTTKLMFSEQGRITPLTDHRFFLLRHSTLLDAMQLSPYVSTTLQLWTKPGQQHLRELLARMGYPLDECKHPYSFLKPSLRRRLGHQLNEYAGEFGLDELEYTSFARVTGFSSMTSASDVCYAVSALLECPIPAATDAARAAGRRRPDGTSPTNRRQQQQEAFDQACFLAAYDALGNTPSPGTTLTGRSAGSRANAGSIDAGIRWAFSLQRFLMGTAVGLVQRNAITKLRHFRYAYITCTSQSPNGSGGGGGSGRNPAANPQDTSGRGNSDSGDSEYHVLAKPLALTRLAHYLMDMHRANGKWIGERNARPLVLLAEQPATNTYLVVGYEMSETQGLLLKNKFGQHFSLVAQTMASNTNDETGNDENMEEPHATAVARLESFDSHVVEVAASHAQRFLEQLHYIMDSV